MVGYTGYTREAFKRGAKKSKGKNLMIPYYYRKKYGNRTPIIIDFKKFDKSVNKYFKLPNNRYAVLFNNKQTFFYKYNPLKKVLIKEN